VRARVAVKDEILEAAGLPILSAAENLGPEVKSVSLVDLSFTQESRCGQTRLYL
jgi:hypothetical protein